MLPKSKEIRGLVYTVYEDGRVYGQSGKLLKQYKNEHGYWYFHAGSKKNGQTTVLTHRIVAELFVDNPHGYPEVDHLDGNRANPVASNLEWVTHQENVRRAAARGSYSGERNSHAKLTASDVINIRQAYVNGARQCDLARQYHLKPASIRDILIRKNWSHI